MATMRLDQPDNDGGHYGENIVLLAGVEVNIADISSREGERDIYKSLVYIDNGEFQSILLLYYSKLILVVVRSRQEGSKMLRRYTWSYKHIKRVTVCEENKNRMLLELQNNHVESPQPQEIKLNILFSSKFECDLFVFRIKTLNRIYRSSSKGHLLPQSSLTGANRQPEKSPMAFSELTHNMEPQANGSNTTSSATDDLFSIENLKKLAAVTVTPTKPVIPSIPKCSVRPNAPLSSHTVPVSLQNASTNLQKPAVSLPKTSAPLQTASVTLQNVSVPLQNASISSTGATIVSSDTNVTVPVEINAGESGSYTLNAEAKISFKLQLDLKALQVCQAISNKEERLNRIRQQIKLETNLCELRFV